jgi:hypothetical protein
LPNAVQVLVKEVESASSTESVEEIIFEITLNVNVDLAFIFYCNKNTKKQNVEF